MAFWGSLLVFHGFSLVLSGAVYAFSPDYTPWHIIAFGGDIPSLGVQRVLFSLYRVVGWTVMACGLSVSLLAYSLFIVHPKTRFATRNNVLLWTILCALSLIAPVSSIIVSFQVGWKVCPWYMPALGTLFASTALLKVRIL